MADFDAFSDLKTFVLSQADMQETGDDFDTEVGNVLTLAYNDMHNRHPFFWALATRPGALLTNDDITTLTITVVAAGSSVAGTLSAAPSGSISIAGYKIRPSGQPWITRVTAHTAGSAAVTLDAVPAALAAGTATVIFSDEYDLATDFGYFENGLWNEDGNFIEIWDLERLLAHYPDPPSAGWPPVAAALIATRRVRFSSYPTAVERIEYPYIMTEANISGSSALRIPQHLRWVVAMGGVYYALLMKSDKRAGVFKQEFEKGIETAIAFDRRARMGMGRQPAVVERGLYTW